MEIEEGDQAVTEAAGAAVAADARADFALFYCSLWWLPSL